MKAILLLAMLVSVNVFAGVNEYEYKELVKIQTAAERAKAPEYYEAMDAYKANLKAVKDLNNQLAKLDREKAFLCEPPSYYADHGVLAVADTRTEYIKNCKASNRYTEESYAVDAKIFKVSQELDEATAKAEQSKVLASYLYAKKSAMANK